MSYTAWSVVFGEQPTAAKWNQLGANDAGFKDMTNVDDSAVLTRHLNAGAVTAAKRSQVAAMGSFTPSANGDIAVTGVGFTPKSVLFVATHSTADSVGSTANAGLGVGFGTAANMTGKYISATSRMSNGNGLKVQNKAFGITTISSGGGSQSVNFEGILKTLDADGFTVTISSYASSGQVIWIAFG